MTEDRFVRQAGLVPLDRLGDKLVTVIGVGAIGRQVALQLASIGVQRMQLIDFDTVELTNVTTQGFSADQLGQTKVEAVRASIERIDPAIRVETVFDRFRPKQAVGDLLFCCVDSISARAAIWRATSDRCDLWIDGRMLGEVVRVLAADSTGSRNHYATTLFSQAEAHAGACTSQSTIYTANVAAGLMLHQLTRWLRSIPADADTVLNLLSGDFVVSAT